MGSSDRFSYEWVKFNKIVPAYEEQFLKWVTPLKRDDFKNKKVLDAGCGTGRNSYWPIFYGAKKVVAFDVDKNTVKVARKNLAKFKNAKVEKYSIYNIPYNQEFDISFSIGVIHHLENPSLAINNLINATKKGGKVLCWLYGYENNEWIVKFINPIRFITSHLPPTLTNLIAYFFSIPFFFYIKLIPQKKDYLKQLKRFQFWHIHSIVLDQLLPKIANYWTRKDVQKLFKIKGIKNIRISPVNSMSWTVLAIKT